MAWIAHVAGDRGHVREPGKLVAHGAQTFGIASVDDEVPAAPRERPREREPEAARRAGDECSPHERFVRHGHSSLTSANSRATQRRGIARGDRSRAGKRTGRQLSRWTGAAPAPSVASERRQTSLDRSRDGFGAIGGTELGEEGADVELHCALTHAERGGDLLVAAAAGEELKHAGLA